MKQLIVKKPKSKVLNRIKTAIDFFNKKNNSNVNVEVKGNKLKINL
jgi:hypothetical protein